MSSAEDEDRHAAAEAGLTEQQQAALTAYHSEQNFLLLHRPQLESMRMPKQLWPLLYRKIYTETLDAANTFVIAQHDHHAQHEGEGDEGQDEDEDDEEEAGFHLVVAAEGGAKAGEDVWILEHAFTAPEKEAVQQLNAQPALVDRLWEMMDLDTRLRREEVAEERRKRREREEEQRREDRKESDDAAEERKVKQAEDEKERERERQREQEQQQEQWTNDESVACVMSQAEASREQAQQALVHSRGDLIDAINSINSNKNNHAASASSSSSSPPAASTTPTASASSVDVASLSEPERRAKRVWDALFQYKYVGCYYTTKPRDERRALVAADVTAHLYVNDEAGSAVVAAANPNAQLCSFMCVPLNSGMSVLWLTRDLEQGEEVIRPVKPAVRKTREWSSG